jgi:uncharacterized DUF497 family protein
VLRPPLDQRMYDKVNTESDVIFEWDDDKAAANLRKHHVAFELAEQVWDDPAHIVVFDRYENGEDRWHAIGLVRGILILTVVHAHAMSADKDSLRIVSARKATADERKRYEAQDD